SHRHFPETVARCRPTASAWARRWRSGYTRRLEVLKLMALDAPEAADAAEAIKEAVEEERTAREHFRRRAAVVIGVLAMLLAIAGVGGGNATKEMLNANIQASDTYAFYQAKTIRQTSNQLAADALESELLLHADLSTDAQSNIRDR